MIVLEDLDYDAFQFHHECLFVGNKCAGGSVLSPQGLVVHDSHAEQLARRGFIRFVYFEKGNPRIY